MSQHDYVIDNQSFPATRTDLNNALSAIVSQNSGASAPSTTYAYQLWYDTTNDTLKMRNSDNDAWIDLFDVNQTTDVATIAADGSGDISLGNFKFDSDQTVGASQDDHVLTYDNATGKISLEAAAGGGGTGSIIKTLYTQFTGTNTITCSGDTVLTDLTVDITPTSTSSIIRIDAMVNGEWATSQDAATNCVWFFYRDTTKLSHASAGSRRVGIQMGTSITWGTSSDATSTPETAHYSYFDAPNTTSQITYKVGVNNYYDYAWALNKTGSDLDNSAHERGLSFICVTEIKG